MERLLEITTQENQIVLDPFMGSGTIGIDCNNLNRHFIGFELDKEYYDIAKMRISRNSKLNSQERSEEEIVQYRLTS